MFSNLRYAKGIKARKKASPPKESRVSMKVLSKYINRKESKILVQAEDADDIWLLYNLIQEGDRLKSVTHRVVQKEGSSKSEKIIVNLIIKVESISFDMESSTLRCKGRTIEVNKYVPLGSYHTVVIDTKYTFTLYKDEIDSYSLKLLHEATKITNKAEVAAIVLQEGVAHFCLMTDAQKVLVAKVEKLIPKKRRGGNLDYDTAMEKFYNQCYDTICRKFELGKLKAILVASPGTFAQNLVAKVLSQAAKDSNNDVLQARSKFVTAYASTGYLQSLDDTLKDPSVKKQILDTRFMEEAELLERFFDELNKDSGKAFYGKEVVEKAVSIKGAVNTLLMTDTLFRSGDVEERKYYISLGARVKKQGARLVILLSLHELGEQLDKMTGVAVLLNYPMHDLEESDEEEVEDDNYY